MDSRPEGDANMVTQTAGTVADKKDLIETIEFLSDRAILQAKGYIERLREEEMELAAQEMTLEEIDAEIAELKIRYGTTTNTVTIAAMKEAEAGIGEPTTLEQIKAECDALRH